MLAGRQIKERSFQTGVVIFVYALVISVLFVCCILLFSRFATDAAVNESTRLIALPEDALSLVDGAGNVRFDIAETITMDEYNRYYLGTVFMKLLPLAAGFFVLLLLLTALLWRILRQLRMRDMRKTAGTLLRLHDGAPVEAGTTILDTACSKLGQKLHSGEEDYKRLSFYLAHEQKNALAVLRTSLENDGHHEYDSVLDTMKFCLDDILTLGENAGAGELSAVDVPLVCAEVCDRYRKITPGIFFDFPDTDSAIVAAKERWISRAVSNLIDNAVKYGAGRPIRVSVKVKKHSVIITVEDHGDGIPEESLDSIFTGGRRIGRLRSDGYGIGLSLVAHVCDICGGYAYAESEPGKGSIFTISLPQYMA